MNSNVIYIEENKIFYLNVSTVTNATELSTPAIKHLLVTDAMKSVVSGSEESAIDSHCDSNSKHDCALHDAVLNNENGQEDDNIPDFTLKHMQN